MALKAWYPSNAMATNFVRVLNTSNGQVGLVPRRIFENPGIFNHSFLVEYPTGEKPPVAELFKPTTPEGYVTRKGRKKKDVQESEEQLEDAIPETIEE